MSDGRATTHEEERTTLFADEAALCLLPFVACTFTRRGQTPVVRTPLSRDHLSAISALAPDSTPTRVSGICSSGSS